MSHDDPELAGELPTVAVRRILKEWNMLEAQPLHDIGIYHSFDESLRKAAVLIIGPTETPYAHGFYLFEFTFPNSYPTRPPYVQFLSCDKRVRFNPNLYNNGKVCLSILGTWPGPAWSSSCTLRTTVLSLQCLLCHRPLRNEPGYEEENCEEGDEYASMLRYENIAAVVTQMTQLYVPSLFEPLREAMTKAYKINFQALAASLDEFQEREDSFDYCAIFDFTTYYAPRNMQQEMQELLHSIGGLVENTPYLPCHGSLLDSVAASEVPDEEGSLPPSAGLMIDARKRHCNSVQNIMVPDQKAGVCLERTEELARWVVASAVDRAIVVVMAAQETHWVSMDTDLRHQQYEAMLPISHGMPKQQARVASKIVAGVVARSLARVCKSEPVSQTQDGLRLQDKWSAMDLELADFCSDCPICFDQINRPVILPCRHSFCADCLLRAISQHGETSCPLCRGPLLSDGVAQQRELAHDEFFDDFFEDDLSHGSASPGNLDGRSLAYKVLWCFYMAPVFVYGAFASLPAMIYLTPYFVYHAWECRQQQLEIDAFQFAEESIETTHEMVTSVESSDEQIADQASESACVRRPSLPRTSMIPPVSVSMTLAPRQYD